MGRHLGDFPVDSTLYVMFDTFDSNGASVTMTGLAVTDIEIYKDGGTTQRASDSGYTLLDTDGIDFDSLTGIHGFSINLSDNTDAGFYAAGSWYDIVVSSITVDSQTVSFHAASFTIEIASGAIARIKAVPAVNATQISGDSTAADNLEADYDGTGYAKTNSTIGTTTTNTDMRGTDNAALAATALSTATWTAARAGYLDELAAANMPADLDAVLADTNELQTDDVPGLIAALNDPTAAAIADAVWDEASTGHVDAGKAGAQLWTDVDAILVDTADMQPKLGSPAGASMSADIASVQTDTTAIVADTNELQTDWANGGRLDLIVDAILTDTAEIGTAGAGLTEAGGTGDQLTAVAWNAAWDAEVQSEVQDALDATLADSVPADGTRPSLAQAVYMMVQFLTERSVSSTTVTVKKVDGSTGLLTLTLNDATSPTSITRAS